MASSVKLTMGDFVKQLALLMHQEKLDMPFKEETPWHLLFYRLKKERADVKGRPAFLNELRFDWDGPYPKCQELSEFIQALHWTGSVIAVNPTYEKIILQDDVAELWARLTKDLDNDSADFLQRALASAKEEFTTAPAKSTKVDA